MHLCCNCGCSGCTHCCHYRMSRFQSNPSYRHMGRSATADLLCASAQARRSASLALSSSALRRLDPERAYLSFNNQPQSTRLNRPNPSTAQQYTTDPDVRHHATHPTFLPAATLIRIRTIRKRLYTFSRYDTLDTEHTIRYSIRSICSIRFETICSIRYARYSIRLDTRYSI